MATPLSQRTGSVFVRNFDEGVFAALGALVREELDPHTGRVRNGYWIDESFTVPTAVQVVFNNPEAIYESKLFPSYLIKRNDFSPALQRWHSVKSIEYSMGITPETVNGVSGFTKVETKPQAQPYDIFYTISCYARYEHEAIQMMKRIIRVFRQYSMINVIDSLGHTRTYSSYSESGIQDISEFVDIADRVKAYQVDIRVEGELDIDDPTVRDTVAAIFLTMNKQ